MNPPQVIRTLLPLLLESSTESVAEISSNSLERILGPAESDEFLARVYEKLITGCYNILANHADPNRWVWWRRMGGSVLMYILHSHEMCEFIQISVIIS